MYTGSAFNVAPEPPKLRKVLTSEIENLSKEISSHCNMPYYVNMQSRKRQNRLDLKNAKIDRFEYRRRDRMLANTFSTFESERRNQIERQMDAIRQAARRSAKGRALYVRAQCGSAKYFVTDKTETSHIPFRDTLQPLDPRGVDTKHIDIATPNESFLQNSSHLRSLHESDPSAVPPPLPPGL